MHYCVPFGKDPRFRPESAGSEDDLRTVIVFCITAWSKSLIETLPTCRAVLRFLSSVDPLVSFQM